LSALRTMTRTRIPCSPSRREASEPTLPAVATRIMRGLLSPETVPPRLLRRVCESPPSAGGRPTANFQQFEREPLKLVDHAVESRRVSEQTGEHGVLSLPTYTQLWECSKHRQPKHTSKPDLVFARRRHVARFVPRLMTARHKVLVKAVFTSSRDSARLGVTALDPLKNRSRRFGEQRSRR
jgi:hypothetical protein